MREQAETRAFSDSEILASKQLNAGFVIKLKQTRFQARAQCHREQLGKIENGEWLRNLPLVQKSLLFPRQIELTEGTAQGQRLCSFCRGPGHDFRDGLPHRSRIRDNLV